MLRQFSLPVKLHLSWRIGEPVRASWIAGILTLGLIIDFGADGADRRQLATLANYKVAATL